jgi:hypothetical protein
MDILLTQEQQAMADTARCFAHRLCNVLGLQIRDGTAQIMKMIITRRVTGGGV